MEHIYTADEIENVKEYLSKTGFRVAGTRISQSGNLVVINDTGQQIVFAYKDGKLKPLTDQHDAQKVTGMKKWIYDLIISDEAKNRYQSVLDIFGYTLSNIFDYRKSIVISYSTKPWKELLVTVSKKAVSNLIDKDSILNYIVTKIKTSVNEETRKKLASDDALYRLHKEIGKESNVQKLMNHLKVFPKEIRCIIKEYSDPVLSDMVVNPDKSINFTYGLIRYKYDGTYKAIDLSGIAPLAKIDVEYKNLFDMDHKYKNIAKALPKNISIAIKSGFTLKNIENKKPFVITVTVRSNGLSDKFDIAAGFSETGRALSELQVRKKIIQEAGCYIKKLEKKAKEKEKEKADQIEAEGFLDEVLTYAIVKTVEQNNEYITQYMIYLSLAGKKQLTANPINDDAEYGSKFIGLSREAFDECANKLVKKGLLYQKKIKGTYSSFHILKMTNEATTFIDVCKSYWNPVNRCVPGQALKKENMTDHDYLSVLYSDRERYSKAEWLKIINIVNRESLFVLEKEKILEFFQKAPDAIRMYLSYAELPKYAKDLKKLR